MDATRSSRSHSPKPQRFAAPGEFSDRLRVFEREPLGERRSGVRLQELDLPAVAQKEVEERPVGRLVISAHNGSIGRMQSESSPFCYPERPNESFRWGSLFTPDWL